MVDSFNGILVGKYKYIDLYTWMVDFWMVNVGKYITYMVAMVYLPGGESVCLFLQNQLQEGRTDPFWKLLIVRSSYVMFP